MLLSLTVVCQAKPWTGHFNVELEQGEGSPSHNFSIKLDRGTLSGNPSDISGTNGHNESGLPSDEKRHKQHSYGVKKPQVGSITWQWFYATNLLVVYELIMTTKDKPLCTNPYQAVAKLRLPCSSVGTGCWSFAIPSYSWIPLEVIIAICWLLKSYWNPDSPLFSPIEQKEAGQNPPLKDSIMMSGYEHKPLQYQSSESSGQQAPRAYIDPGSSFTSSFYSDSGDGDGDSQQHSHTMGLNCFVHPCRGVCQFRPAPDNNGSAEWPPNSVDSPEGEMSAGAANAEPAEPVDFDVTTLGDLPVNADDTIIINGLLHLSGQIKATSHSAQSTCDETVTGDVGQPQPSETACKSASTLPSHKNKYHTGQKTCDATVVGKDGLQRPCANVCKNARALTYHRSKYHSGQRTCEVTVTSENGQQQSCGKICKNARALTYHKRRDHSRQLTCELIKVGKDGRGQQCEKVCKNAVALSIHKRRYHSGRVTCEMTVIGEDGQRQPCGKTCNNPQALWDHKSRLHTGLQTCDTTVIGEDGQPRPCGSVFKNARVLSSHKSCYHTGKRTCDLIVVREDGQPGACGRVYKNTATLSSHKNRDHSRQKTCTLTVVGEDGQSKPCGKVCKNALDLSNHKRIHRKRKPVDVEQDD
ncbi:hypothetical protein [Endozoicomonas sp. 8E]|uniref:hypothetical protein n=1 Tax=Endozoicomonas sp. 8E TaxID=3035692 RepID=UPI00293917E1|nr:hypothetical protein [Endozoicomonas sp. 8E]WOG27081.1 hypothetical protein P6910_21400 [Endozoicomonas sp. 8E]